VHPELCASDANPHRGNDLNRGEAEGLDEPCGPPEKDLDVARSPRLENEPKLPDEVLSEFQTEEATPQDVLAMLCTERRRLLVDCPLCTSSHRVATTFRAATSWSKVVVGHFSNIMLKISRSLSSCGH